MAVKVRCEHCSALFNVSDAFAGARCRCKYCGGVTAVPQDPSQTPSLPRPMKPAARQPNIRPIGVPSLRGWLRPNAGRAALWAFVLVSLVVVLSWQWFGAPGQPLDQPMVQPPPTVVDRSQVARVPLPEARDRLPRSFLRTSFKDVASVAWLIDCGDAMSGYYSDVSTLVATAMSQLDPSTQRLGLCLASESHTETLSLTLAGGASLEAARIKLRDLKLKGSPNLLPGFTELCSWKPQMAFVLLARPTDQPTLSGLIEQAQKIGLQVNVVTIGEPYHGWASLALETKGEYRCLRAVDLQLEVARVMTPVLGMLPASEPVDPQEPVAETTDASTTAPRTRNKGDLRMGTTNK